ncbi:MAG: hypothetical protein H7246_10060 [Phycisphaerae bacterium]|nr:hypothetical protein [Saprospiraceae bacterium]
MNDPNSSPIILHSNWRAMRLGMLGWVILGAATFGLLYLYSSIRGGGFDDYFRDWHNWAYVIIAAKLIHWGLNWWRYGIEPYAPNRWKNEVRLYLDKKEIEIIAGGKSRMLPFEHINRVIYQGSSPIFTTYYLYWVETKGKQTPLLAFTNEQESNKFYDIMERQARLTVVQKPSSP